MRPERRAVRVRRLFVAGLVGVLTLVPGSAVAAGSVMGSDASAIRSIRVSAPVPDDTEPETSEPDATEPETPEPVETTPADPQGDQGSDDVNETVAIVSLLAFAVIVGVAAWWMVRRDDEDDMRQPPKQTSDEPLPGQDLV